MAYFPKQNQKTKKRKEKRKEKDADLKKGKFSLYFNLVFKDTKFF